MYFSIKYDLECGILSWKDFKSMSLAVKKIGNKTVIACFLPLRRKPTDDVYLMRRIGLIWKPVKLCLKSVEVQMSRGWTTSEKYRFEV